MLAIFNKMYLDGQIMEKQNHGIVLCISKTEIPTTPADYRPITLLNTVYKILVFIIAVRHRLTECGVRQGVWELNCTWIFRIQRTNLRRMPMEWLLRPCYKAF